MDAHERLNFFLSEGQGAKLWLSALIASAMASDGLQPVKNSFHFRRPREFRAKKCGILGNGAMARSWEGSSLSRAAVGFPGRRNKTLQSGRLGATEIYPLPFPEAESPKSRCRQDHAPSAGSRGGSSCLSSALGTAVTLSLELPPPTVGHAPATCVRVPVSEKCQSLGQGPP